MMDGLWALTARNCTLKYIPGENASTVLTGVGTSTSSQSTSFTATQNTTLTATDSGGAVSPGVSILTTARATGTTSSAKGASQSSNPSGTSGSEANNSLNLKTGLCILVAGVSGWLLGSGIV
jgi:hypothetical protein